MVKSHLQFAKLLEDKGAGVLALTIFRHGIFKPTPKGQTPLTWLQERDHGSLYKFVDGSKLRARAWAREKLEVERGAQHVFLGDRSEQWKRSLGSPTVATSNRRSLIGSNGTHCMSYGRTETT